MSKKQIHYVEFDFPDSNSKRVVRISLPANYSKQSAHYPVAYLQDGQNLFEASTAAFDYWKLVELFQKQPNKRQMIVVGIDHGHHNRMHEYAFPSLNKKHGAADKLIHFITQTVKPFVDAHYRTIPQREHTILGGSSMGGLFAFAGLVYAPHIFGKIISLSPSIWYQSSIIEQLHQHHAHPTQLYVSGSKTESVYMQRILQQLYWKLKQNGFADEQIRIAIKDRGRHNEKFWHREFKQAIQWMYP